MQNPLTWLVNRNTRYRHKRRFEALRHDPHLARDVGLYDHWVRK